MDAGLRLMGGKMDGCVRVFGLVICGWMDVGVERVD